MKDSYGREINYLRVSVTQKCNLNCIYCGSESPDEHELTVSEISECVRAFAKCGIEKVRLTGGEPLVRADICEIATAVKNIDGIKKVVLTTNGTALKKYAHGLAAAGVDCINVSLDSLDDDTYKKITGSACLPAVLDGIRAAEAEGMKVRVNSVLIRGCNDDGAAELIGLAKNQNIDVRFIELMPFADAGRNSELIVRGDELLRRFDFLRPIDTKKGFEQSVARYFTADGFSGRVGFISPVSEKFCDECNRIRLLSDGRVKPCLGHDETVDLKPFFGDADALGRAVSEAIFAKPKGHEFNCGYGNVRAMNKIGG